MRCRPSLPWLVVIAGSSGSVQALSTLVSQLPANLPAAVLVVIHGPATSKRRLPILLSAKGPLPASYPDEGQPLEAGRIFVAPPDQHLLVRGRRMRLTSDEKEHHMRPAADVLFRSAARAFGSRSIGIVLSGDGRDGAEGLARIQAAGGLALIQAPADAQMAAMPSSALSQVKPDACVPAAELAATLSRFVQEREPARGPARPARTSPPRGGRRPRPLSLKGLRVFIAEDDYLIASEIVGMLRVLGCSTMGTVASVREGLRFLEREHERMDCAILDVDLRGEKVLPLGLALARCSVPFLFATGYGETVFPEGWADAPLIQKPYDARALGAALRRALRRRWSPAPETPALGLDVLSREEALKDSRNLLMRYRVLRVNPSEKILTQAYAAIRKTHECIATSKLRKEAARRTLRSWLSSGSGGADDAEGNGT